MFIIIYFVWLCFCLGYIWFPSCPVCVLFLLVPLCHSLSFSISLLSIPSVLSPHTCSLLVNQSQLVTPVFSLSVFKHLFPCYTPFLHAFCTMVLDLLILPATSPLATNQSSESCRSGFDEANSMEMLTLGFILDLNASTVWLCPETLSIDVTNRTQEKSNFDGFSPIYLLQSESRSDTSHIRTLCFEKIRNLNLIPIFFTDRLNVLQIKNFKDL